MGSLTKACTPLINAWPRSRAYFSSKGLRAVGAAAVTGVLLMGNLLRSAG